MNFSPKQNNSFKNICIIIMSGHLFFITLQALGPFILGWKFLLMIGLINGLLWEWIWKLESTLLLILFMSWLLSMQDLRTTFCVNANFILIQNSSTDVSKEQWMDYCWLTADLLQRIPLRQVVHVKLHVEFFHIIHINV